MITQARSSERESLTHSSRATAQLAEIRAIGAEGVATMRGLTVAAAISLPLWLLIIVLLTGLVTR